MSLLNPNLEAFMAIVETSTVHGAAKIVGLSQTGVTQRIRSLETAMNVTLFTRSRKGMLLTAEGNALHQYCIKAMELEGEILAKIDPRYTQQEVRINITAPSSLMRSRVIPALGDVLPNHPEVVVNFNVADNNSGVNELKRGTTQLAIILKHEVANEFDSKLLNSEEYILVAPYSWRKIPLREIIKEKRIIDFNKQDDCTINYLKKFKLYNLLNQDRHFVNNTDALTALIISGQGYSVLSKKFAEPFIRRKEIIDINPGKIYNIDFALAWYPRNQMPAYLESIIASIQ